MPNPLHESSEPSKRISLARKNQSFGLEMELRGLEPR